MIHDRTICFLCLRTLSSPTLGVLVRTAVINFRLGVVMDKIIIKFEELEILNHMLHEFEGVSDITLTRDSPTGVLGVRFFHDVCDIVVESFTSIILDE